MEVVITTCHSLPCSYEKFTINGMDADVDDFGRTEDIDPANAEPYGCGDMQFVSKMPTDEILAKYFINLKEYAEICDKLGSTFAVGSCGWCI